jgi:8-oxo-dGTP diphosphatase
LEETTLVVKGLSTAAVTNSVFEREKKHYITLFAYCEMTDPDALPQVSRAVMHPSPTPRNMQILTAQSLQVTEPDKCEGWEWMSWEELIALKGDTKPGELIFLPLHSLLEQTPNFNDLKPTKKA